MRPILFALLKVYAKHKKNDPNEEDDAEDDSCLCENTPWVVAVKEVSEGHRLNDLRQIAKYGILVDGHCLGSVVHCKEQLIDEGTAQVNTT